MNFPDYDTFEDWKPEDFPIGFVAEAGSSKAYITGGWRSMRPVWQPDNCTNCMMCWIACPDSSIEVEDAQMTGIDYEHCKGCGVCVHECRFNALEFIREDEVVHEQEDAIAAMVTPKEA